MTLGLTISAFAEYRRLAMSLARRWRQPTLLALSLVGGTMLLLIVVAGDGSDLRSYWHLDVQHLYSNALLGLGGLDAFRYSPPVAFLMAPLGLLPWPEARMLWLLLGVACVWLIARRWTLASIALYPVALELSIGNIHLEMAVAIAYGLRFPALWSFILLTKVTPGVGLIWFVVRREWRHLAIALGTTALIVVASFAVSPALWGEWLTMLGTNAGQTLPPGTQYLPIPLLLRLPVAAGVTAWAAHSDRAWLVPLAATLALPTVWPVGFSVALACLATGPSGAPGEAPGSRDVELALRLQDR